MPYGPCRKNHAASTGSFSLDGCLGFVGRRPGDSHCLLCGCHVGFHVQPEGASHQLAAISVDPGDISYGACKHNVLGLNEKNLTVHDGCQRFVPTPEVHQAQKPGEDRTDEPCFVCGCPKMVHDPFYSTPQADASFIMYTGECLLSSGGRQGDTVSGGLQVCCKFGLSKQSR